MSSLNPQNNMIESQHRNIETCLALLKGGGKPLKMRLKGNSYYSAFRFTFPDGRKEWIGVPLNAKKGEELTALENLGTLIGALKRGDDPRLFNKKLELVKDIYFKWLDEESEKSKETIKSSKRIAELHIVPFFGEMICSSIDEKTAKDFVKDQEARLKTPRDTLKKRLRVLKDMMQRVNGDWSLPSPIKFKYKGNTEERALTFEEVKKVLPYVAKQSKGVRWKTKKGYGHIYEKAFLVLTYSGMRPKTVVNLTPKMVDLKTNWIDTTQSKVFERVRVPISRGLRKVFDSVPWPIDPGTPIFQVPSSKAFCRAVGRAFKDAGVKGSAKSQRHFTASAMFNNGIDESMVGMAIGHSKDSRCTRVYIHPYDEKLVEAFDIVGDLDFENEGEKGGKNEAIVAKTLPNGIFSILKNDVVIIKNSPLSGGVNLAVERERPAS